MTYALILVLVIEVVMYLVPGQVVGNTSLTTFLLNPSAWVNSDYMRWLNLSLAAIGAGGIIAGTFVNKFDWVFRAGLITTFLSFGLVITRLWQYLYSKVTPLIGSEHATYVVALIVGPIIIFYFMTLIDFISAKD